MRILRYSDKKNQIVSSCYGPTAVDYLLSFRLTIDGRSVLLWAALNLNNRNETDQEAGMAGPLDDQER